MPLYDFLGGPADTGVKKTENDAAYDVDLTSDMDSVILMSETSSEDGEAHSPPSPLTPTRTSPPTETTPQHSPQSVIDVAFVEGLQRDLAKNQAELARSLKQHREDRAQQIAATAASDAANAARFAELFVLFSRTTAPTVPLVDERASLAEREAAAQEALVAKCKVNQLVLQLFSSLFTRPLESLKPPSEPQQLSNWLDVVLRSMGVLFLALTTALRYQHVLDFAATTIDFSGTGLPALSLDGLGSRIADGSLTFDERNNPFVQASIAVVGKAEETVSAVLMLSATPKSPLDAAIAHAKLVQKGDPKYGFICALSAAAAASKPDERARTQDLLEEAKDFGAESLDLSSDPLTQFRTWRARNEALSAALSSAGLASSLSHPQAMWFNLRHALGASAIGRLLATSEEIAQLSGNVNYTHLMARAETIITDEARRAEKAAKAAAAPKTVPNPRPIVDVSKSGAGVAHAADKNAAAKTKAPTKEHLKANAARSLRCFNCGAREHVSSLCPIPPPPDGQKICWTCRMVGHVATACPSKSSRAEPPKNP